jgi:hypothetical protein
LTRLLERRSTLSAPSWRLQSILGGAGKRGGAPCGLRPLRCIQPRPQINRPTLT